MAQQREIFVLAGPNGAGKSTTAGLLLPDRLNIDQFVNADLIAQGLSPFAPDKLAIQAGYLMLERIHDLRAHRESFAFETTLATRSYLSFLREAQRDGYLVHLIYIWLSSVQLALSRVAVRVQLGGHGVPSDVVERRYWRGLRNFFKLYQSLANTWTLCDNSDEELVTVARCVFGERTEILDPVTYRRIQEQVVHGP
jgi:predicted ABC-type ATPase